MLPIAMAGLYIHIPFCHSKCSYCDFYSGLRPAAAAGYIDAVIAELQLRRREIDTDFTTIYIGGGTPSILPAAEMQRLVEAIAATTDMARVEEFTIEVNPEDVTGELLAAYRSMGVNRISMGVQSFDNELLAAINRRHTAAEARAAIDLLREEGWNYSIDLMFGLPGQTMEMWQADVDRAMKLRPPHISAYLLSYEPGTRLYAMLYAGKVTEASEELADAMQQYFTRSAAGNGFLHYEISNYSQPGRHSRHNSAYWNMTPYLGLGASAHSYDGHVRRINPPDIKRYLAALADRRIAAETEEENIDELFNDFIITGLRTADGLSLARLQERFPESFIADLRRDAAPLIAAGQLQLTDRLAIPQRHWLKVDAIMRDLLRI